MRFRLLALLLITGIAVFPSSKVLNESMAIIGSDADGIFMHTGTLDETYSMHLCTVLLEHPKNNERSANDIYSMLSGNKITEFLTYLYTGEKIKGNPNNEKPYMRIKGDKPEFLLAEDEDYYDDAAYYLKSLEQFDPSEAKIRKISGFIEFMLNQDSAGMAKLAYQLAEMDYKVSIYSEADNVIEDDAELIIDRGGDDIYKLSNPNTIIIDLGGNDIYAGGDYSVACAVNGFACIADVSGDDEYIGGDFSIACGINGIGMILDMAGNDTYRGSYACIGAGFNGAGLLFDRQGSDTYISQGYSQAFGFVLGTGLILDEHGSDVYNMTAGMSDHREPDYSAHLSQGFGFGIRDIASGGAGILMDMEGNDRYTGEYFTQGSSYWIAYGLLYDCSGNDIYTARRYSQGAGTHFTTGILIDKKGNDYYVSWGVSQGCGHDYAVGMLMDYDGNDVYSSEWLSQGAGNANGLGLLADFDGDDMYSSYRDSGGYGQEYRSSFSIGIMFDNRGDDIVNGRIKAQSVRTYWGFSYYEE